MSSYQVNVEEISTAANGIKATASTINAEVSKMHSKLISLQNSWKGSASNQFQNVVGEWNKAQKNVENALTSINNALNIAGKNYLDAEQSASQLFRG